MSDFIDPALATTLVRIGQLCPAKDYDKVKAALKQLAEAKRRFNVMASSNSDDYRWYQSAARQACRSLGCEPQGLDWE